MTTFTVLQIKGRLVPHGIGGGRRKELPEVMVVALDFEGALATYRARATKLDPGNHDVRVEVIEATKVDVPFGLLISRDMMKALGE